jgi:hypothetical protein
MDNVYIQAKVNCCSSTSDTYRLLQTSTRHSRLLLESDKVHQSNEENPYRILHQGSRMLVTETRPKKSTSTVLQWPEYTNSIPKTKISMTSNEMKFNYLLCANYNSAVHVKFLHWVISGVPTSWPKTVSDINLNSLSIRANETPRFRCASLKYVGPF